MTVKEYLNQGYRLVHRIRLVQAEIEGLRAMSTSISSPGFEEHFSRSTEAPFEKVLMKIYELEEKQAADLERLLCFKQELIDVIDEVEDKDLRMVLRYRYVNNFTWGRIGDALGWDARTIRRWHDKALTMVSIPEDPIIIDKNLREI